MGYLEFNSNRRQVLARNPPNWLNILELGQYHVDSAPIRFYHNQLRNLLTEMTNMQRALSHVRAMYWYGVLVCAYDLYICTVHPRQMSNGLPIMKRPLNQSQNQCH